MSWQEQEELRSGRWRRTSQGFYVPTHVDPTASQRVCEAGALTGAHGAIGGWAAAHWQGSPFMNGVEADGTPIDVLVYTGRESHRHRQAGIDVSRDRLPASDVVTVGGLRCTTPLRTAFDLARRAATDTRAVMAIDTLLECGLIAKDEFREYVASHTRWRGVPRARLASELSLVGVRSPQESRLRMIWHKANLPPVLVNVPVFSVWGYLIGIADLYSDEAATTVEYDGADHLDSDQRELDRRRDARFAAHGIATIRVTKDDINGPRSDLIARLRQAFADGTVRERALDRWTLTEPDEWRQRTD